MSPPRSASASAASTPAPPPLVRIVSRSPDKRGAADSDLRGIEELPQLVARAARRRAGRRRCRRRPSRRARRCATSPPWRPSRCDPDLRTITGLARAARLAAETNFARRRHLLHVDEDRAARRVAGKIVEQVAEIDVRHVAERDDLRQTYAARRLSSR